MAISTASRITLPALGLMLVVAVILFIFSQDPTNFSDLLRYDTLVGKSITIQGARVVVDVADTEDARQKGLSGRQSLLDGRGLLMVFPSDVFPGIWVKDMRFPIDIIWIDSDWKVVQVTPDIAPATIPKIFYPDYYVRYILEVPADFADVHAIKPGDKVAH